MSRKDKLVKRLKSKPKDFTFDELVALLNYLGFYQESAGKTGGSRVLFSNGCLVIRLHKPHPRNELKMYQIDDILQFLEEKGFL